MKNWLKLGAALLFFSAATVPLMAQTKQIEGTVVDETSAPVFGAIVGVKNVAVSASTDTSGHFSITIPDSVRFISVQQLGYITENYAVSDQMKITLKADALALKEIVVTALGVPKEKKSLGYAVANVSSEDIARSGEQNVIQALSAKAAGIQVTGSGGTPGASSKIIIRGNQTFSGNNQPLIVVDGVPVDNSTNNSHAGDYPFNANLAGVNNSNRALDINPDDIESVTILKGPAAAALYGSRAGTGAILFTTKKGKYKKGLGVTFGTSMELSKVNKLPEQQKKYAQGNWLGPGQVPTYQFADAGPDNTHNTNDDLSFGTAASWGPTIESLAGQGVSAHNNTRDFFETGKTSNSILSIDGGNENTMYRFSYSNVNQNGVIPNSYLKRNTVRLTAEHRLQEKLKVGTTISFANTLTQLPQNGSNLSGIMVGLMRAPASYDLKDYQFSNGNNKSYFSFLDNPYYTASKNPFNQNVNRVFGNTYLNYDPAKWLNVTYRIGLDAIGENNRQIYAVSSNGDDNGANYGQVNYGNSNTFQLYSDLLLTAKKDLTKDLHASLILGNNIWHNDFKSNFARGRNLSIPDFYNLNNSAERYASNNQTTTRTYAGFYDLELDYKGMIYLSTTGRNEWSSNFGSSKNNFFFPSVSGAFIISEMVKLPKWFSFAKVRASYAQSGIAPSPYSSTTYYQQPTYTDGYTNGLTSPYLGNNAYAIGNVLGSPGLGPERVTGNEFGADLRFFSGRLNLDVTYYSQKTEGILLPRPIAPSSGYRNLYSNYGKMSNQGWEIVLTATPLKTKDLRWDISINWQKNVSKVLELAPGVDEINIETAFPDLGSYAIVGQPYGAFYGTKWQYNSSGQVIINPATGLPYLDPKTQNLGNPYPDWLGSIRNTVNYKKFSLSFLFDIRKGGKIWNGTKQRMNNLGTSKESEDREGQFVIDGVLGTGAIDDNGNAIASSSSNTISIDANRYWRNYKGDAGGAGEGAIEDGGWVRLRDLSLSYHLVIPEIKKFVQYVDLTITGRNVWLKTKYSGVDPETSLTGAGSNLQGYDYFNNPGTKSILFGIKVGF
jgi:TonB-linked SusC/RagA family outer membrane protein